MKASGRHVVNAIAVQTNNDIYRSNISNEKHDALIVYTEAHTQSAQKA